MRAANLGEPGVFGSDAGIVQSGGDRMGGFGLTVLVLQDERAHAVQYFDLAWWR